MCICMGVCVAEECLWVLALSFQQVGPELWQAPLSTEPIRHPQQNFMLASNWDSPTEQPSPSTWSPHHSPLRCKRLSAPECLVAIVVLACLTWYHL